MLLDIFVACIIKICNNRRRREHETTSKVPKREGTVAPPKCERVRGGSTNTLEEEERQSQSRYASSTAAKRSGVGNQHPLSALLFVDGAASSHALKNAKNFRNTSSVSPTYLALRNRLEKYHALLVPLSILSPSLLICCICCCVLTPESRKRTSQIKNSALPNVIPRKSVCKNERRKAERIPETHQDEQIMPQRRNIDTLLTKRIAGVDCQ